MVPGLSVLMDATGTHGLSSVSRRINDLAGNEENREIRNRPGSATDNGSLSM